jgi:UDP-3-O-[3-hydroxymyristoyl] glucosamine N-acyltransferase
MADKGMIMSQHYTLLGHCNVTLGIILDSLYSQYGSDAVVEIVSNIADNENALADRAYLHHKIKTNELYYSNWQPSGDTKFILTGMSPNIKSKIFRFFLEHFSIEADQYRSSIHKSAVVCNGVEFEGAVNISPLTVIAQYAKLGKFVTLNRNVSIGHHTELGEYTTVNPGCNIGGSCKIGKNVVIGIGTTVFDNIEIGDNTIIGGGSLVTKSIPPNTLAYGAPAKVIKTL